MSIEEILEAVRVIDQGGRQVVQLDYEVWEEVVNLLQQIDEAHWQALFADDRSERVLAQMVDETLADIEAGQVSPVEISEDENLVPG
ncbi:MAG: hypothetical protein H6633_16675 [Anaerolineales bacterium]|nr:hypothetical protein [Anaerolineales bacterium]